MKLDESVLVTDEYKAYNVVDSTIKPKVTKHKERFVDGEIHTNTIKDFLLKRAWYGSQHHYRKKFTPLYVAEACYKYNHRKNNGIFSMFIRECFV